jgi:hypothetical protein
VHRLRCPVQIFLLLDFDELGGDGEPAGVIRATLVRDQDDCLDVVYLGEESDLLFDTARIPERLEPVGEDNGPSRARDPVVTG